MKLCYSLKIQRWHRSCWKNEKENRGAITLLTVFLFVIFATLGLSMLYLTQVYLKISAYRKNTMLLEYASENGIKQGYDHLFDLLSSAVSPILLTEEEASQFLSDTQSGGGDVVRRLLGSELPFVLEDSWERQGWESLTDFQLISHHESQEYFRACYRGRVASTGSLWGFEPVKASYLDSRLELLAGHVPLPAMAFLVDKPMTGEQERDFMGKNDIQMLPSEQIDLPPPVAFSDGGLLPQDAVQQLAKALKIEIFHPQDLSAAKLRLALGLEVIDEPVPDGVYLIQDDLGLGGVFVQGNLDEMILAIQASYQIIAFRQEQDLWVLRFSPEEGRTVFSSPSEIMSFDLVPLGIIVVNGKIFSLGGGYENDDGQILMTEQEEIACVKNGVKLTIISSDEITLTSHLIYQGVTWKEGVPYVKDSDSQLVIHASGHDFVDGEVRSGEIIIDEGSPDDIKIHASISASGNGVTVSGEDKKVQLLGSLQTSELALNENELSIKFDERFFRKGDGYFQNAPLSKQPVLYLFRFNITEWRDN
jgi:hypothetical protein